MRVSSGDKRKTHGKKTGQQVPQPAKEVAERQGPGKTGQEEVTTRSSHRAEISPDQPFSFASRPMSPRSGSQ
jgi:hypothetical protein